VLTIAPGTNPDAGAAMPERSVHPEGVLYRVSPYAIERSGIWAESVFQSRGYELSDSTRHGSHTLSRALLILDEDKARPIEERDLRWMVNAEAV
jgi:hypothetical protein